MNMIGIDSPVFKLLVDDDKESIIGSFNSVFGIERSAKGFGELIEIRFFDGDFESSYRKKNRIKYKDIIICICDIYGGYIARLSGVADEIEFSADNHMEVILKGRGLPTIAPSALLLWLEWRKNFPLDKGRWVNLDSNGREAWLEVALLYLGRNTSSPVEDNVEIDGANIVDLVSFLCSIGEAFFGAGGYMGRSISAFEDCLSKINVNVNFAIVWSNSESSKDCFINKDDEEIFKSLLLVMESSPVNVILN